MKLIVDGVELEGRDPLEVGDIMVHTAYIIVTDILEEDDPDSIGVAVGKILTTDIKGLRLPKAENDST